jgi:hypothetical protein
LATILAYEESFLDGETAQIMHTSPPAGRVLILSGADDYLGYILFNNRKVSII